VPVDENTGLGGWGTVSVREFNREEESAQMKANYAAVTCFSYCTFML
jgi:hypothetical protein